MEEEYEEKQSALREKREMERKMQAAAEQESPVNRGQFLQDIHLEEEPGFHT